MPNSNSVNLLITVGHLKRKAIIYVRQSTEKTAGSRALHQNQVELARACGWPDHLIEVIDEDMGKGGFSIDDRTGWQRTLADIVNNAVGIVFATSVSRLTRQPSAYEQLQSLVADHGALLCIGNRITDPSDGLWRDHQ
jgi:DNA invertase Pin-like site-specific DNA recombinase